MITPQYERKPYKDQDEEPASRGPCPLCAERDPQRRTWHHLALAKQQDLAGLRAHLTHEYVHLREAGKKRQDVVDSICTWVLHLMEQYSSARLVDEHTGAPLIWWQVRDHMTQGKGAMAQACYRQASEEYQALHHYPGVPGFRKVETAAQEAGSLPGRTPREPGEEDMSDWPDEERIEAEYDGGGEEAL